MKYIVLAGLVVTSLGGVGINHSFAKGASSLGDGSDGVGLTLAEVRHLKLQKNKKAQNSGDSKRNEKSRKKLNR